jgi:hypothetical protein
MNVFKDISVDERYLLVKPFLFFIAGIALSIIVVIVGIYFSVIKSDWSWFARLGALLVVIALILATVDLPGWMVNLLKLGKKKSSTELKDSFSEIFKDDIKNKIKQCGNSMSEADIEFHASIMAEHYQTNLPTLFSIHMKSITQKIELIIAALGTFIWAFGDLPNMYIQ